MRLKAQVEELGKNIASYSMLNPSISKADVGWHIEHTLLAINAIIGALKTSEPSHYMRRFTWSKLLVLTTGFIPRGRAISPKVILPGLYSEKTLQEHLRLTIVKLGDLENIGAKHYFEHPYFGDLQLADTIHFLEIHTHHHLTIIGLAL